MDTKSELLLEMTRVYLMEHHSVRSWEGTMATNLGVRTDLMSGQWMGKQRAPLLEGMLVAKMEKNWELVRDV